MGSLNDQKDEQGLYSRLPADTEYWDALTSKIMHSVSPTIKEYKFSRPIWWAPIARLSKPLAVGAIAATTITLLLLSTNSAGSQNSSNADAFGLVPVDPLAATMVMRETPPSVEALWIVRTKEEYR